MYGRLVTATGWSYEYIDRMCVSRAFDTLEYLSEHPPADEILAAVHLKPKTRKHKSPKTVEAALSQMQAMSGTLAGGLAGATRLPPQLRDMALWALDQKATLNKTPVIK